MAKQGVGQSAVARRIGASVPWVQRRISMAADVAMTFEDLDAIAGAIGVDSSTVYAAAVDAQRAGRAKASPGLDIGRGSRVRPEGFEPPTFWLGVSAPVIDLAARRAERAS